jgi:hypothetical protein
MTCRTLIYPHMGSFTGRMVGTHGLDVECASTLLAPTHELTRRMRTALVLHHMHQIHLRCEPDDKELL